MMGWFWTEGHDGKKVITDCQIIRDISYQDCLYTHSRLFEAPPLSQVKEGDNIFGLQ